ncbi:MAG: hypothetical protein ARM1_0820 [Candidatus Micrarchaeota archaeon]|nr:MAG: hypothetical protein ARM1_0820 [Candidatus Micrarchaeota archaeon]
MDIDSIKNIAKETWHIEPKSRYADKDIEALYVATALSGEVGELLNKVKKLFRSKYYTEAHSDINAKDLSEEFADILYYLSILADIYNIKLSDAFNSKMEENRRRYGTKS